MFEWPIAHPIDLALYPRRKTYELFLDFENPTTTRTIEIDLTCFMAYLESRRTRFMPTLGFILMRALNHVPEFRQRIQDGMPVEFEKVIPAFTVLTSEKQISYAKGVYTDQFENDYVENCSIIDAVYSGRDQDIGPLRQGVVFLTNNPWNAFTSLAFPFSRKLASIPIVAIGKLQQKGEKRMAPLAIQSHHSFVDGYQVAHFLDIMFRHLECPALIESEFVSRFS